METDDQFIKSIPEIEGLLKYRFSDRSILQAAFTHRSFLHESGSSLLLSNERLEFLGDAVLELLITDFLYRRFSKMTEGELSQLRASLVGERALIFYEKKLRLSSYLLLGKGEESSERKKDSLYADLLEAVIGAIYADGGMEAVQKFVFGIFEGEMLEIMEAPPIEWKTRLQEFLQKEYKKLPEYELIGEEGPDHDKTFRVVVKMNGEVIGEGVGRSKKEAEQGAAKEGFARLRGEK